MANLGGAFAPPHLCGKTVCASNLQMRVSSVPSAGARAPLLGAGCIRSDGGGSSSDRPTTAGNVTFNRNQPMICAAPSSLDHAAIQPPSPSSSLTCSYKPVAVPTAAGNSCDGTTIPAEPPPALAMPRNFFVGNYDVLLLVPHPNPGSKSRKASHRRAIAARCRFLGLDVSVEKTRLGDQKLIKLSAPEDLLEEIAELMTMEKRLKIGGYTDYKRTNKRLFQPAAEGGSFFSSLERCRLILALLELDLAEGGCGLDLHAEIESGVLDAVVPVHESANSPIMQRLMFGWCLAPLQREPDQPLDEIRDYFGEQIALYFAFVQSLTTSLIAPSIVGAITVLAMLVYGSADNPLCPLYSVFILLWVANFCKTWRREEARLAFRWNVEDFESTERERTNFRGEEGLAKGFYSPEGYFIAIDKDDKLSHVAPTTKVFLPSERRRRTLMNYVTAILPIVLGVVFAVFGLLAYRSFLQLSLYTAKRVSISSVIELDDAGQVPKLVREQLHRIETIQVPSSVAVTFGSILGGICNSIFILISNALYARIARRLNDWENHRTETEYTDALVIKTFAFQFVNSYASLFYIAFIKAAELNVLGFTGLVEEEYCHDLSNYLALPEQIKRENGGLNPHCMGELSTQLVALVVTMQLIAKGIEFVQPKLSAWYRNYEEERVIHRRGVQVPQLSFYEEQIKLEPFEGVFDEYNRLIIQIGYIVLFAPAFPLASLVCYGSFLLEIRADAYKLLVNTQRPCYAGAQDIGSWQYALIAIAVFGALTNVGLIGYTSTAFSAALPFRFLGLFEINESNKIGCLFLLEHALLASMYILLTFLPDYPQPLAMHRAKAKWRQAATVKLAEAGDKPIVVDGQEQAHPRPVDWDDDTIPERFWKERGWGESNFFEPRRPMEMAKLLKAGEHKQNEALRKQELAARMQLLEQAKWERMNRTSQRNPLTTSPSATAVVDAAKAKSPAPSQRQSVPGGDVDNMNLLSA